MSHQTTTLSGQSTQVISSPGRTVEAAINCGLFAIALLVYNATLTPSLSYLSPDGNELATIPYILGLAHSTGYPLYTWLGKLFTFIPIGDIAHRINLMSAVLGAGSVVFLNSIGLILLEPIKGLHISWRRVIAGAGALLFAFSTSFWSQTGIAEVYAPNLFMVGLQIWLLLRWTQCEITDPTAKNHPPARRSLLRFGLFCLVFALSTGTHSSNLGFGLGYAVFVLMVNRRFAFHWRALLIGIGLFAAGMLQHLWLPYKASTLTDTMMIHNSPTTWQGFYHYTLGAFANFKFAFTRAEVPDRIVIYLDLLRRQFGAAGILTGIVGMWVMLFTQVKRWWLITLMYVVHLVFFTQYRVFDLDVFFIPAHYLFAMYLIVGMAWLMRIAWAWLEAVWPHLKSGAVAAGLSIVLVIPVGVQLIAGWETNDRSGDVAINDFYHNVWEILPQDSILLGRGGVFGYDMFYWRLVYDVRPDVLIPTLPEADQPQRQNYDGRPIFTNFPATNQRGPGAGDIPPELLPRDAWYIPILLGESARSGNFPLSGRQLALYEITQTPPDLLRDRATPSTIVGAPVGGDLVLLGYDLNADSAYPGGHLHLTLYWQGATISNRVWIASALGDIILEEHLPGLGNLDRILQTRRLTPESILVEDYRVVIPSTVDPDVYRLNIQVAGETIELEAVTVTRSGLTQ